jgi:HEAT repeat protein
VDHLSDPREAIMTAAISALEALGDPKALPALQTFDVGDDKGPKRKAVRSAIAKLKGDQKPDQNINLMATIGGSPASRLAPML